METLIFAPLAWLYQLGTWIHRRLQRAHRLPFPVLSVGNISMGGRAKTPLVIHLCRRLRAAGFLPVVLTRGYGRKSREPVLWTGGVAEPALLGDEATEIARSGVADAVLVGPRRFANAQNFLWQQKQIKSWVFVLDDGFQHWALARDVDVVVVTPEDLENHVVPQGELRETPAALARAHVVLQLGRDLVKETVVAGGVSRDAKLLVLTTRAAPRAYQAEMKKKFGGAELHALRDHASSADMQKAIRGFEGQDILLGDKEAVKLLTDEEYRRWLASGELSKKILGAEKRFYRASLVLSWKNEHQTLQSILKRLNSNSAEDLKK